LTFAPDGRLWEVEHGPRGGDELNLIEKGKNYGWPVIVHGINYPGTKIGDAIVEQAGARAAAVLLDRSSRPPAWSSIGATSFRSGRPACWWVAWPARRFSVWSWPKTIGSSTREPLLTDLNQRIRDVRVFQDGAVYVLTDRAGGKLLKLTPNNSQTRQ